LKAREGSDNRYTRLAWWVSGLAVITGLVYLMATANTGLLAGTLVVGSYVLAEHVKVRRRVAKGEQPAVRAEAPPGLQTQTESL
jgi:hypothetical protein